MPDNEFIDSLVALTDRERTPETADVIRIAPLSVERTEQRLNRLVDTFAEAAGEQWRQRDPARADGSVAIRLPGSGHAVAYAASGSMVVNRGLPPMEQLIGEDEDEKALTQTITGVVERLRLSEHIAAEESLEFEKLWRIKAAGADNEGHSTRPVLCRAVGAFRHVVRGLPVWGPASAVVSVAAGGQLDRVEVHARQTAGEPVDVVRVLRPEEAAMLVLRQLTGLLPSADRDFSDIARPVSFQFGYFALNKRKSQTYLAPAYVAMVEVQGVGEEGEREGQLGYVAVVNGGEKDYLQFARSGNEARALSREEGNVPPRGQGREG